MRSSQPDSEEYVMPLGRRRPIARAAAVGTTVEKISELAQLHASGALTDEEFAAAKAKALGI